MKLFCSFGFEDRAVIPDVLQRAQLRMMNRVGIQKKDKEGRFVLRKKMCLGSRAIKKKYIELPCHMENIPFSFKGVFEKTIDKSFNLVHTILLSLFRLHTTPLQTKYSPSPFHLH